MEDPRWISDWPGRAHAFCPGSTRSLCGQVDLPVAFTDDPDIARCGNCQRIVVQKLAAQSASSAPETARWQNTAVQAVLGDGWTYDELVSMPSFRAEVDRVAVALANAYKEGIMQGNASARTGK